MIRSQLQDRFVLTTCENAVKKIKGFSTEGIGTVIPGTRLHHILLLTEAASIKKSFNFKKNIYFHVIRLPLKTNSNCAIRSHITTRIVIRAVLVRVKIGIPGSAARRDRKIHSCQHIVIEGGRGKKRITCVHMAHFGVLTHCVFVCFAQFASIKLKLKICLCNQVFQLK